MTALHQERRKFTAKQMAEHFGVSERTIRRLMAEPRGSYEAQAQAHREQIIALKRQGMKQRDIASTLGVTPGLVSIRLREAREAGIDLQKNNQP